MSSSTASPYIGVLIFGPSFFWFHRESDKCAMIKLPRKKKIEIAHLMAHT